VVPIKPKIGPNPGGWRGNFSLRRVYYGTLRSTKDYNDSGDKILGAHLPMRETKKSIAKRQSIR